MNTFKESQRFSTKLIYGFSIGMTVFLVVLFRLTENDPTPGLFVSLFIVSMITWLLELCELKTEIDQQGIRVKFEPFHRQPVFIRWEEIEYAYLRTYQPILEYGGWGVRQSFKGQAYNISGNRGLQIILKNGRYILIGTQKDLELEQYLRKHGLEKQ